MKVAVIGSNGQLGSDLVNVFSSSNHEVISLNHEQIKVEEIDSARDVLKSFKPNVIINTAAFHNLPQCEEDPLKAYNVNSVGSLNIAIIANDLDAINIYYSTDYVFDGKKRAPYLENDNPNPLNIYACTKLVGEFYALNYSEKTFVFRISGLYGKVPCRAKGGNFITTMLKFSKEKDKIHVVNDEVLTPTPTLEIAKKTLKVIKSNNFGRYHLTSEGECSWYDFAKTLFDTLKIKTPLIPCSTKDFPSVIKRPFYSVLENHNLKKNNFTSLPHWRESLITFSKENYS